jgi:hypothetical protein
VIGWLIVADATRLLRRTLLRAAVIRWP